MTFEDQDGKKSLWVYWDFENIDNFDNTLITLILTHSECEFTN